MFQWTIKLYWLGCQTIVILASHRFHQTCNLGHSLRGQCNKRVIFICSLPAGGYSWAHGRGNNALMHVLCVIMLLLCTKQMASMGERNCPQLIRQVCNLSGEKYNGGVSFLWHKRTHTTHILNILQNFVCAWTSVVLSDLFSLIVGVLLLGEGSTVSPSTFH